MDPAQPNPKEFERLQKLLALKRYEEPPPGFFDRMPGEVRARIAHAAAHPEPWWRAWLARGDITPNLATSYAALACVLVVSALWLAGRPVSPSAVKQVVTTPQRETNPATALVASNMAPTGLFNPPTLPVQPASFPK